MTTESSMDMRGFTINPSLNGGKEHCEIGFLEADGRVCQGGGDSVLECSGQRYIPLGDSMLEKDRLATFIKYPDFKKVKFWRCAGAGFSYTGKQDETKCSGCGYVVEGWSVGDDPYSSEWHKIDCPIIDGTSKENVPLETPRTQLAFCRDYLEQFFSNPRAPYSGILVLGSVPTVGRTGTREDQKSRGEVKQRPEKSDDAAIPNPEELGRQGTNFDAEKDRASAGLQGSNLEAGGVISRPGEVRRKRSRKRSGSDIGAGPDVGKRGS